MTLTITKENPLYYKTTISIPGIFLYEDTLQHTLIVTPLFRFAAHNKEGIKLVIGFCKM